MLLKVWKMIDPIRTITFPHISDKVFSIGLTVSKMVSKTILYPTIFVEVKKMMALIRTITFQYIPDRVFSLVSLFQEWYQRQFSAKPFY